MNTVEPIKDLSIFDDIFDYLEQVNYRDYMLVFLGINVGLRISDLRKLTIYDVMDKKYIYLRETKTSKERRIEILPHVKIEINKYLLKIKGQKYLFEARYTGKPISRHRAYQILKRVELKFNLQNLGTHTLRKTFGYHFYSSTTDIATLMLIFNHSKETTTLKYIGMSQDKIDTAINKWGGIKRNEKKLDKDKE